MFDYRTIDQERHFNEYGRFSANFVPHFPYHQIGESVPIYLFGGGKDSLTVPEDVAWIKNSIPGVKNLKSYYTYNHIDFTSQPEGKHEVKQDVLDALISEGIEPIPWPQLSYEEL